MAKAKRVRKRGPRAWLVLVVVLGLLLGTKVVNYAYPHTFTRDNMGNVVESLTERAQSWYVNQAWLHSCGEETQLSVPGGFVCVGDEEAQAPYGEMFRTYQAEGGDAATVYPDLVEPDLEQADALVAHQVKIPRFEPIDVESNANWSELDGPSVYWKFYYYSLRPTVPLTLAYISTGNPAYLDRLHEILDDFSAGTSTDGPAWEDSHAVAFRAITLTWQWWTLRQHHVLSEAQSQELLQQIEECGDFLMDANHFEPNHNHGVNEAAALLNVATVFPDLAHADQWRSVALSRISLVSDYLVEADGFLIENSPYYHFNVLAKLWQVRDFARDNSVDLGPDFGDKLSRMVDAATWMLQPDGYVPELGASLTQQIHRNGVFAEMADASPEFKYVLTQGLEGTAPATSSRTFPTGGLTMFRQSWGEGADFRDASFMTFNVGRYRTQHSHYDLMGVTLYGDGGQLLPDAGLYTYQEGDFESYFRGSSAHNVVVVDDTDQQPGLVEAGELVTNNGVTYQAAATSAYPGIKNRRLVAMVDEGVFLVVDRLRGSGNHQFDQTWHLPADSTVSSDARSITSAKGNGQRIQITQLGDQPVTVERPESKLDPPTALCSQQYEVALECPEVQFRQTGSKASYVTLITTGETGKQVQASYDAETDSVSITTPSGVRKLDLGATTAVPASASAAPPKAWTGKPDLWAVNSTEWTGGDGVEFRKFGSRDGFSLSPRTFDVLATTTPEPDALVKNYLMLRVRFMDVKQSPGVYLDLTSPTGSVRLRVNSLYDQGGLDNEWVTLTIPTGAASDLPGRWYETGKFDWSNIQTLTFDSDNSTSTRSRMDLAWIGTVPKQSKAVASIVFDDGYTSILPAAQAMRNRGMPGNVAVIGRNVTQPHKGALTIPELRQLQDEWGWNLASHTQYHRDITVDYTAANVDSFEEDLLEGQEALSQVGLDSAPNWLIYPHGASNDLLQPIVSKYYTFARTTLPGTDSYPFGDPLRIHNYEIWNSDGTPNSVTKTTKVSDVRKIIADAKASDSTLMLTFHRIKTVPSDRPGYPIKKFKQILNALQQADMPVLTLTELEKYYGVSGQSDLKVDSGQLAQTTLKVELIKETPKPFSLWEALVRIFG